MDTALVIRCYSGHAQECMLESGISADAVEEAVRCGRCVPRANSYTPHMHGRMRVVMSGDMVVTVWREKQVSQKRNVRKARRVHRLRTRDSHYAERRRRRGQVR